MTTTFPQLYPMWLAETVDKTIRAGRIVYWRQDGEDWVPIAAWDDTNRAAAPTGETFMDDTRKAAVARAENALRLVCGAHEVKMVRWSEEGKFGCPVDGCGWMAWSSFDD